MAKETKRPILTASGKVIYGETPEDGIIAKVYGDPELATLFAAAPELLESLKDMTDALAKFIHENDGSDPENAPRVQAARAAIAKATA